MSELKATTWPQVGLEIHIKYVSNFFHLNVNLGGAEACADYFGTWVGKYRTRIRTWNDLDAAAWAVRTRQSLKSTFVAAHFALAAGDAQREGSLVTFYYLSYYAVLHAVWGVLYLHPDQTTDGIAKPTHSKLPNVFQSEFCDQRRIIRYPIKDMMTNLRLRREYYSYRMPLNSPYDDEADARGATSSVGGIVKQCIQLANLHSHLLAEAADREQLGNTKVSAEGREQFIKLFRTFNSQRHPARDGWFLEPADESALREFLTDGCGLSGHSLVFEHMFDEFLTYEGGGEADLARSQRVKSLVYSALL